MPGEGYGLRMKVATIAIVASVSACAVGEQLDRVKADSENARSVIRRDIGADAQVSCRIQKDTNGMYVDVQVRFLTTPPGTAAEVKEKAISLIKSSFRDPVGSVVVFL